MVAAVKNVGRTMLAPLFLVLTLLGALAAATPLRQYDNCQVLSGVPDIRLHWKVDYEAETIAMAIEGISSGYIAVGLSEEGDMANRDDGADAWLVSRSDVAGDFCEGGCVLDLWNSEEGIQPDVDQQQDISDVLVRQNGTYLVGEFVRPLNPGTAQDSAISVDPEVAMNLIWAYHPFRPVEGGEGATHIPNHYSEETAWQGLTQIMFGKNSSSCDRPFVVGQWSSPNDDFRMWWDIDETETWINFTVEADCTGYVSLGMGALPQMQDQDDIVWWWDDRTGEGHIIDTWSPDLEIPDEDTRLEGGRDDIVNATIWQADGVTYATFARLLDTGDVWDWNITHDDFYIGWAYHWDDDGRISKRTGKASYSKHTHTGTGFVNFFTAPSAPPPEAAVDRAGAGEYTSPGGQFRVAWQLDEAQENIEMTMAGRTNGWISVGFSPDRFMSYADYVTGWVADDGSVLLYDTWSPDTEIPRLDTARGGTEDHVLVSGAQADGWTTITFTRPLVTGDRWDIDIRDETAFLHWALHPDDGVDGEDYPEHTEYDVAQVNFFSGEAVSLDNGGNPSLVIGLVCGGALLLYALAHYCLKAAKASRVALAERGLPAAERAGKPAKATAHRQSNRLYGAWHARVPGCNFSWASATFFALYLGLNVGLVAYYAQPRDLDGFALSFGYVCCVNAVAVMLPAMKNSPLLLLVGEPFERTVALHRWAGRLLAVFCALHGGLYWASDSGKVTWESTWHDSRYLYGTISFISAWVLFFTSLPWVRRGSWEFFFWTHYTYGVFFVFGALHSVPFKHWTYACAGIYFLDKAIRFVWGLWVGKAQVEVVESAGGDVLRVHFPVHPLSRGACAGDNKKVGQYHFLNFPQVAPLQWHPYSLSSNPMEGGAADQEVCIRGGNFYRELLAASKKRGGQLLIRVDGPYGHINLSVKRYPVVVLVAGGIGLTPTMSLMKRLFLGDDDFTHGNDAERALRRFQRTRTRDLHVIWTVRDKAQFDMFAEEFARFEHMARTTPGAPRLHLRVHCTTAAGWGGISGGADDVEADLRFAASRQRAALGSQGSRFGAGMGLLGRKGSAFGIASLGAAPGGKAAGAAASGVGTVVVEVAPVGADQSTALPGAAAGGKAASGNSNLAAMRSQRLSLSDYELATSAAAPAAPAATAKAKGTTSFDTVAVAKAAHAKEALEMFAGTRFHRGRPDVHSLLRNVQEATEVDGGGIDDPLLVFACGPEGLVNGTWDASSQLLSEGKRVDFHREEFNF